MEAPEQPEEAGAAVAPAAIDNRLRNRWLAAFAVSLYYGFSAYFVATTCRTEPGIGNVPAGATRPAG